MDFKLDHIFVLVEPGAKSGDILKDIGFLESFSRKHKGQGTENRRFVFDNGMLELLYIHDPYEAEHGSAKELKLLQRSRSSTASPFGLVFSKSQSNTSPQSKPFKGFHYQPDFFPEPMGFHIADNAKDISEPLCIYGDFINPDESEQDPASNGVVDSIVVSVMKGEFSPELSAASKLAGVTVVSGSESVIEINLNGLTENKTFDLRPQLPIIINT